MNPKSGSILISEPFLKDSNFSRTVILLCEHNKDGTFGLVMNRKIEEYRLPDIMPELEALDAPLYYGGPVQPNTLHFLHTRPDLFDDCMLVTDNIYWGGKFEELTYYISTKQIANDEIRFFIGYSGWGVEQLEAEIKENTWMVHDGKQVALFEDDTEKLWRSVLRDMGGKYKVISNFPIDPSLN